MAQETLFGEVVDGWLAIYAVGTQNGTPVVTELRRVVPCPPAFLDRDETSPFVGRELVEVLDGTIPPGPVPPGGMTGRLLRKLNPSGTAVSARDALSRLPAREAERWYGFRAKSRPRPRRPGRPGHSDRFYAELAAEYVDLCRAGIDKPVVAMAKSRNDTEVYIRDAIHVARKRELLTPSPPGKAGGQLTDKGTAALGNGNET